MKKVLMSLMLTLLLVGGGVEQHEEGFENEILYSASSTSQETLDDLIRGEH